MEAGDWIGAEEAPCVCQRWIAFQQFLGGRVVRSINLPFSPPPFPLFSSLGTVAPEPIVFALVNAKIDDLMTLSSYDWAGSTPIQQTSEYVLEIVTYLRNTLGRLVNLSPAVQGAMHFEAVKVRFFFFLWWLGTPLCLPMLKAKE